MAHSVTMPTTHWVRPQGESSSNVRHTGPPLMPAETKPVKGKWPGSRPTGRTWPSVRHMVSPFMAR